MARKKSNDIRPWEEVSSEVVVDHYGRAIEKTIFKEPSGKSIDFYLQRTAESPVCVLALTPDDQVVLARQFRPGPRAVLYELPGGRIDKGETPQEAVARELLEETGYRGEIEFVTRCLDEAYSNLDRYCFVARNCVKVQEPTDFDGEYTQAVLMDLPEFRQLLRSGRLTDVEVGYLGLDHLGLL